MSVVLVTGSSSGIGLATVLHFARRGHDVYAGVRSPGAARELTEAIQRETLAVHPVALDVDHDASVARAVREVLDRAPRIDVLVNNAGIGGGGAIESVPMDFAKAMFETNYFGAIPHDPGRASRDASAAGRRHRQRELGVGAAGRGRPRALRRGEARAGSGERGAGGGSCSSISSQ